MTPLEQEMADRLAKELLGWELLNFENPVWFDYAEGKSRACYKEDEETISNIYWNPFFNIEQAMWIAKKIGGLRLYHSVQDEQWIVDFTSASDYTYGITPEYTICLAAIKWLDAKDQVVPT